MLFPSLDAISRRRHGRCKHWLDGLAIDILPVPNLEDDELATRVVNEIDNAVAALTYSVPVRIPGEFLGLLCARVDGQAGNLLHDSSTVFLRIDILDFLSCR
jgi:hypothetical protein